MKKGFLFALAAVSRIAWALAGPARIDSDYGLYVRMGQYYAEHGKPEIGKFQCVPVGQILGVDGCAIL